jgi:hypothetical protein
MTTRSDYQIFKDIYKRAYKRISASTDYDPQIIVDGKLKSTQYLEFGLWPGGRADFTYTRHKLLLDDSPDNFTLAQIVEDEPDKAPFSLLSGGGSRDHSVFFKVDKLQPSGRFEVTFTPKAHIDIRLNGLPLPAGINHTLSENDIITFPSGRRRINTTSQSYRIPAIIFRPGFIEGDFEEYKRNRDQAPNLDLHKLSSFTIPPDKPEFIVPPIKGEESANHLNLEFPYRLRLGFDRSELINTKI